MQFQVPQFIEVESKIFGPLTLKQFIYLAGGAGIVFILYSVLPFFLTLIIGLPIIALALALAFYKVNNQPFIKVVENAFNFISKSKLYLWEKEKKGIEQKAGAATAKAQVSVPKLSKNKLKDLAWSLDIKEKIE
jgi:hypothetical protein